MPKISALVRNHGEVTIGEGDEALHVSYAPDRYTPELEELYRETILKRMPSNAMAYLLSQVLKEWDLVEEGPDGEMLLDGDGRPAMVAINLERLKLLPTELISAVVTAITEDVQASKEDRKNSRRGSLAPRKS